MGSEKVEFPWPRQLGGALLVTVGGVVHEGVVRAPVGMELAADLDESQ